MNKHESLKSSFIRTCNKNEMITKDNGDLKTELPEEKNTIQEYKKEIVWVNVFILILIHLFAIRGIYVYYFFQLKWQTWIYATLFGHLSGIGVTLGGHRLYAHRTYKAIWQLRLFLIMCHTMAGQNSLYTWCRDHRQHHKYSDTNADPHNSNRGFFFCHMGWLLMRKHPSVFEKGRAIDMSDLKADPFVEFQRKYYIPLFLFFSIFLPAFVPCILWEENVWNSFCSSFCYRYLLVLHMTWSVNSLAHFYGMKPYNKNVQPVENLFVSIATNGEGWHNYHHAFPWDYRAGEIGKYNINAKLIELFEKFGLASDLRKASKDLIRKKVLKYGDGSHIFSKQITS